MLDSFKFTLYELFGYLIPGAVTLVALALLFWSIFFGTDALPVYKIHPTTAGWVGIVVFSYLLGHSAQALSNQFVPRPEDSLQTKDLAPQQPARGLKRLNPRARLPIDRALVTEARKRVAAILKVMPEHLSARSVFGLCDETVIQHGAEGDRDVYVYREGYYRGTAIACVAMIVALAVRMCAGTASLRLAADAGTEDVEKPLMGTLMLVFLIIGWFSGNRYRRFAAGRVTRTLAAFLVTAAKIEAERKVPTVHLQLEDAIRVRAHALYLARGQENGCAMRDWLDAEADVLATHEPQPETPKPVAP